jgi:charged multivesicular body protein 3
MGIFGQTKKDPKDQVRELQRKMRTELTGIQRQINAIEREEEKVKRQIKDAAKKGDKDVCRILAKSIVQSRKVKCFSILVIIGQNIC